MERKIGFIGCGKLAGALIEGFVAGGVTSPKNIYCTNRTPEKLRKFQEKMPVHALSSNKELAEKLDIIILAVKPQNMQEVLEEIKTVVTPQKLVISIAAGLPLSTYENALSARIIRTLPNIPCLVQKGVTAIVMGKSATKEDDESFAVQIFSAVGAAVVVNETQINALSILTGCGPAFFAYLIDAFAKTTVLYGIPQEMADDLALQTAFGAAALLRERNITPQDLIVQVSSPKGITVAGREVLEHAGIEDIFARTFDAALKRNKELSTR
ncbi:pyrroline-5-carboxylate reductase [Candidatus Woesearchaeota archaeon]|nr:pyrroline-5-carboxylate reductase [Candidatus Woesearchaeota archaeon]